MGSEMCIRDSYEALNRGGSYEMGADGADGWPWSPDETPGVRGHAVEFRQVTTWPELRW